MFSSIHFGIFRSSISYSFLNSLWHIQILNFLFISQHNSSMDKVRELFPFLNKSAKDEKFSWFLKNEKLLVEELVVSFHGRYKLPIPCFSADELFKATENFSHLLRCIDMDRCIFKGTLKERQVLVITCNSSGSFGDERLRKDLIHNIVITSQMSHIKNVLKLFGCCLEFKYPAMVYENSGTKLVFDILKSPIDREGFSWKTRLKVAKDIANVIFHLHTDFPKPIVFKVLTPSKVLIDHFEAARLVDFTYSIYIPPGESKVLEDSIRGRHEYLDPEYALSGYVTQKTDVYSLGVLMLLLITGERVVSKEEKGSNTFLIDYVESCLEKNLFNKIVDPYILKEEISNAQKQEMQAFVCLALRCTRLEEEDRPDMIDVAKELSQIEKKCSHILP